MDRQGLQREIAAFKTAREMEAARARQLAALQLACHVDLGVALNAEGRKQLAVRLERMIERERQRGVRKHWSYDLNRHIALKEALDGLTRDRMPAERPAKPGIRLSRGRRLK